MVRPLKLKEPRHLQRKPRYITNPQQGQATRSTPDSFEVDDELVYFASSEDDSSGDDEESDEESMTGKRL